MMARPQLYFTLAIPFFTSSLQQMSCTQESQYDGAQQRAAQNASAEAAMDPANLELLNKDIARLTGKTEETQVGG